MATEDEIHIRKAGRSGRITLTRPKALNALTYGMCMAIGEALDAWQDDPEVEMVVIDAEGSRAFCAGGDIADMYSAGQDKRYEYGRRFWTDEYRINADIHNYPKPYVAIMDGIVMGGGVGISAHGSHRIVTENTLFAMPECAIGLAPDVGGNWLLARAPGHIGEYLATTGARLGAADCIFAGIADRFVSENHLPDLIAKLEETGNIGAIEEYSSSPPDGDLADQQERIDNYFSRATAKEIVLHLEREEDEWAANAAKLMRRNCPLSVACSVDLVRNARNAETIEDVLRDEFRFTSRSLEHGDFIEGIRAQIIDKDRNPRWNPATLEELSDEQVKLMLSDLGELELTF